MCTNYHHGNAAAPRYNLKKLRKATRLRLLVGIVVCGVMHWGYKYENAMMTILEMNKRDTRWDYYTTTSSSAGAFHLSNETTFTPSLDSTTLPQQQEQGLVRIAHVMNVFASEDTCPEIFCPLDQARNVSIASIQRAVLETNRTVATVYAAVFPEDAYAIPPGMKTLSKRLLRSTWTEYPNLEQPNRKLPFLDDILSSLYDSNNVLQPFDYVIYTNSDIAVQPNFYDHVAGLILDKGFDGFVLNRRDDLPQTIDNSVLVTGHHLDQLYLERGSKHPGYDCFVFKKDFYRNKFTMGNMFLGYPPVGQALMESIRDASWRFRVFDTFDKRFKGNGRMSPTFHLGSDRTWKKGSAKASLWLQNIQNYKALVKKNNYCRAVQQTTLYSENCRNDTPATTDKHYEIHPLLITGTPRSGTVFMARLLSELQLNVGTDTASFAHHSDGMVSWVHIFQGPYKLTWLKKKSSMKKTKFRSGWRLVRDPLKCLTSIAFTEPLDRRDYEAFLELHISLESKENLIARAMATNKTPKTTMHANHSTSISQEQDHVQSYFLIHRALEFYIQWHEFINILQLPIFRLEDLVENKNMTTLDQIFHSIGRPPPNHQQVLAILNRGVQPETPMQEEEEENERASMTLPQNDVDVLLKTNARQHRETLDWNELCRVNVDLTRRFLLLSQEWGYYPEKQRSSICSLTK